MDEPGHREWSLRDFDIGRPLGKGHFGQVYLARIKSSDFIVALKCLKRTMIEAGGFDKQVAREIEIMQTLRHPNVVRMYDYFSDGERLVLILEYAAQGELYRQLQKRGRFLEPRAAKFTKQVADGLAYLHSKNIIHRDIKPENLFLGLNGEIKIGDFGWSVHSPEGKQKTQCGTPCYLAPEMVLGLVHGPAIDIWALGVLAFELTAGFAPFEASERSTSHKLICRAEVVFPPKLSPEAQDFILALLRPKPADRMPLDRVPTHPWIVGMAHAMD